MGVVATEMVRLALQEWEAFGRCTRSLADEWHLVSNEVDEPYLSYISRYWAAVGETDWNGATPEPWSGAFISWCFVAAGAEADFTPKSSHFSYIRRIYNHGGMSPLLRLRPPTRSVEPGDLIWNARGSGQPRDHEEAIQRLVVRDKFDSHADIVVEVRDGECDSIGGNVYRPPPMEGGSVVRSTWQTDGSGALVDARKNWLGVVKNAL